jgi:hypothetical protein
MRPFIPVIDLSIVERSAAQNYHGDTEKVATTTVRPFVYKGIDLSSRYDKADEYETLLDLVDSLDSIDLRVVKTIFSDSKSNTYCVSFGPCNVRMARHISAKMEKFFNDRHIWHNGVYVQGAAGGSIDFMPTYDEDVLGAN